MQPQNLPQSRSTALIVLCYLTVYIAWGGTYLAMRIAVREIAPFMLVGIRFATGGVLLLALTALTGGLREGITRVQVRNCAIVGALLLLGGNGLVSVAVRKVDSYVAALLVASTPVLVLIVDRILFGRKTTAMARVGAVTGIAGVAVLLMKPGRELSLSGHEILVIGGVTFWALGSSLGKVLELPRNALVTTALQMTIVGVACLIGYAPVTPVWSLPWGTYGTETIAAVIYLSVVGTTAFVAFVYLMTREPLYRVVTYSFVNPLIAIALGMIVGGEKAVAMLVPGAVLILGGLAMTFYGDRMVGVVRRKKSGS